VVSTRVRPRLQAFIDGDVDEMLPLARLFNPYFEKLSFTTFSVVRLTFSREFVPLTVWRHPL